MEMTLLTAEQLRLVYDRDLSVSFPRDELKPFRAMERMLDRGSYRAWGLMDGEDIAGLATVWNYAPGWALFDYLCVAPHRRSDGLGSRLVQELALAERDNVLFGESELPEFAPDPDMARRRIGFYRRHGFAWNDYAYMQPALRPTESPIPLRLMTRNAPLPEEEFHRLKKEIYKTVYGVE